MKHLFNNLSSEEKNSILEQHKGGKIITNENFNKLTNHKSGDVKLIKEDIVDKRASDIMTCFTDNGVSIESAKSCVDAIIKNFPIGEIPTLDGILKVISQCSLPIDIFTGAKLGKCIVDILSSTK